MILDCSSLNSTKLSLSKIFKANPEELMRYLKRVTENSGVTRHNRELYEAFCSNFCTPRDHTHTIWFHGTRCHDLGSFMKYGILPKSEAQKIVHEKLIELSQGLEKIGSYKNLRSVLGEDDEGPFGFLIKYCVPHPERGLDLGKYASIPEGVEDIAGKLLGDNRAVLLEKYFEVSKSYVIRFIQPTKNDGVDIDGALQFLYFSQYDECEYDAGTSVTVCFNGRNSVINPKQILSIEEIQINLEHKY